jgi:hypothetical protein
MKALFKNHNANNDVEIMVIPSSMVLSSHTPLGCGSLINLMETSFELSETPSKKPQKITMPFESGRTFGSCGLFGWRLTLLMV